MPELPGPGVRDLALRAKTTGYDCTFERGRVPTPRSEGTSAAADDDAALIARVAARDGQAFRMLVERHLPALLGIGRRMLRDEAEAEDVAQEALVRLWQTGATLNWAPAGPSHG